MIRFLKVLPWRTTPALLATLIFTASVITISLLSGCATGSATRPVPEANFSSNLPPVAAEYLSLLEITDSAHSNAQALENHWRFWREDHLVIRDNLDTRTSDLWRSDGTTITQKKLFHDDKRGVEFQPDDLRMLSIEPQWQKLVPLFDTALLDKLPKVDSGWRDNVPYQRYAGQVDNVDWTIELRTDLMLPLLIEYKAPGKHETIQLVSAYPLAQSPWIANTGEDYVFIDFADLGDMQSDPFVKKVEILLGGVHHH